MKARYDQQFYRDFAKRFCAAMHEQGYTTNRLATVVDEQYTTIKRIEDGEGFLVHHLIWIKNVLGITIEDSLNSRGNNNDDKEIGFSNIY